MHSLWGGLYTLKLYTYESLCKHTCAINIYMKLQIHAQHNNKYNYMNLTATRIEHKQVSFVECDAYACAACTFPKTGT